MARLADDVDREESTLERALKFYRLYPISADRQELSWNHYKCLITIPDKTKREAFEKMAQKRGWTAERLEEAIRLDRLKYEEPQEKPSPSPVKLSVTRSRLYTYQVLEPTYIHPIEEWLTIDVGFSFLMHKEIRLLHKAEGETSPKSRVLKRDLGGVGPGELVESRKSGNNYSFTKSEAAKKELYTYKALVERVVDADTIYLNIDLGFDSWYREKIRSRGIDTPELDTKEGQEAKKFVEARLKEVEFVVVKTYKEDKHGRYLVDIFYLKGEDDPKAVLEQGVFLNQELLDRGLARPMSD